MHSANSTVQFNTSQLYFTFFLHRRSFVYKQTDVAIGSVIGSNVKIMKLMGLGIVDLRHGAYVQSIDHAFLEWSK